MTEEESYWVAFSVFPGIGPVRFRLLLSYFNTAKNAYLASQQDLNEVGLPEKLLASFLNFRNKFNINNYLKRLENLTIKILTLDNLSYPPLLKAIPDSPFLLYCLGNGSLSLLSHNKLISIVGTRKITSYGLAVTRDLTKSLVANGCVIVSGMAIGVDGQAHKSALEAHGSTIAVLGCGVDIIAPASHRDLYFQIKDKGLIISEMPLGLRPDKGTFPARNRIISGLTRGVVVTEGAKDSGSLITARYAAEQGREVFAVPGQINNPMSEGPSILIKNGARLITSAIDILEDLNWLKDNKLSNKPENKIDLLQLTKTEQDIIKLISQQKFTFDELVINTNIASSDLASILTTLEVKGIINQNEDHTYHLFN